MSNYLNKNFPSNDETDGEYLFRNLGSFWYQIFSDSRTLRGYTMGMAEELIQSYIYLIELINSFSIKDIDIYHKEKWYPLIIKKSEFNNIPFLFEPEGAVFGPQPSSDDLYRGKIFRFGFPKETIGKTLYTFKLKESINKICLIADKIINPEVVLMPGVDYYLEQNILYFNSNIFDDNKIIKYKVLEDLGKISTYTASNGETVEDEFIILWTYNTEIDKAALYENFGVFLNIKFESSDWYKDFLKYLFNLSVESATISALRFILATVMRLPIILENHEIVEDIYSDDIQKYVITNKNVYKLDLNLNLAANIKINNILNSGDFITDNINLFDSVINPNWWRKEIETNKLAFPSHIFLVDCKKQLLFSNNEELVFYSKGKLTFPVLGVEEDVTKFQENINNPENKIAILKALNLFENTPEIIEDEEKIEDIAYTKEQEIFITTNKNYYRISRENNILENIKVGSILFRGDKLVMGNAAQAPPNALITINPINFIFSNVLKNNTVFLKLNFNSINQLTNFFNILPGLKPYLPPHVYFLIYLNFNLSLEELNNFNFSLNIPEFGFNKFSCDGSIGSFLNAPNLYNSRVGGRPQLTENDSLYYKDYVNRLFCISVGPYRNGLPLHHADNLENLNIDNSEKRNNLTGIKCGLLRTEIPLQYTPPGEDSPRKPSTREIQAILLIDF